MSTYFRIRIMRIFIKMTEMKWKIKRKPLTNWGKGRERKNINFPDQLFWDILLLQGSSVNIILTHNEFQ